MALINAGFFSLSSDPLFFEATVSGAVSISPVITGIGMASNITWDFGDGNTATGGSVNHTYATTGPHTLKASIPEANMAPFQININGDSITNISEVDIRCTRLFVSTNPALSDLSVLSGLPNMQIINAINASGLTVMPLANLANMTQVVVTNATGLNPLVLTGMTSLSNMQVQNCNQASIDFSNAPNLTVADIRNNSFTSVDFSPLLSLVNANVSGMSGLTSLTLPVAPPMDFLNAENGNLPASDLDSAILALDAGGVSNGTYRYGGHASDGHLDANRSTAATTAITNLTGKGWTRQGGPY